MKFNYITNIPQEEISGGFSAMNAAAYEALSEAAEVHYVGPVNPPKNHLEWLASKVKRSAGIPGEFFAFSDKQLGRIALEVDRQRRSDADFDFFHGFTPWSRCEKQRPYLAWSDCCFRDYVDIYHAPGAFQESDLSRICSAETAWMQGAEGILLSSEWARRRTQSYYGLVDRSLHNVSIFGAVEIPRTDEYLGGHDFLFISTDYRLKNGPICRTAMNEVWQKYPNARLKIIGAPPRAEDLSDQRVSYCGYLNKSDPKQFAAFCDHLSKAFALLHPTGADTTAMVVIEAAFYGCPSITVDDFALPEVTDNGAYACLLRRPVSANSLALVMIDLLDDVVRYRRMRTKARQVTIERFSRRAFKKRLQSAVLTSLRMQRCR
jgi:glycosyltransferase involved in cell wall biosynthesis